MRENPTAANACMLCHYAKVSSVICFMCTICGTFRAQGFAYLFLHLAFGRVCSKTCDIKQNRENKFHPCPSYN